MESPELIRQVKRRTAIWSTEPKDHKKIAVAWKQICKMAWADFHTLTPEDKRNRCLELQKKWNSLMQSFTRDHLRQEEGKERSVQKSPYYDQLLFLSPTIGNKCSSSSSSGATCSNSSGAATSTAPSLQERDAEEDRQFLLSLVSFMQDVPRSDKLTLRSEILQVIAKYTNRPRPRVTRALSQEY